MDSLSEAFSAPFRFSARLAFLSVLLLVPINNKWSDKFLPRYQILAIQAFVISNSIRERYIFSYSKAQPLANKSVVANKVANASNSSFCSMCSRVH